MQASNAVANPTDDLSAEVEGLLFASWRYRGCQLIQRSGGWQVYNTETDTFLGAGFPTVHWDPFYSQTFTTKGQAIQALAHAKHPPKHAGGKGSHKIPARKFDVSIDVDQLITTWRKENLVQKLPAAVETAVAVVAPIKTAGFKNALAGWFEKMATMLRTSNDKPKGLENG